MVKRSIVETKNLIKNVSSLGKLLAFADVVKIEKSNFGVLINMFKMKEIEQLKEFDLDKDTLLTNEYIIKEFSLNFKDIFSLEKILDKLNNLIFINYIEAKIDGKGYGTEIVEYIKSNSDGILLYPHVDAVDYWRKNGFKEVIGDDYYIFTK